MNTKSYQRSDRVHFYDVGLAGAGGQLPINTAKKAREDKWRLETLTGIKAMLKHQNVSRLCLFVYLSVGLSVGLTVCLSVGRSVCPCVQILFTHIF